MKKALSRANTELVEMRDRNRELGASLADFEESSRRPSPKGTRL